MHPRSMRSEMTPGLRKKFGLLVVFSCCDIDFLCLVLAYCLRLWRSLHRDERTISSKFPYLSSTEQELLIIYGNIVARRLWSLAFALVL